MNVESQIMSNACAGAGKSAVLFLTHVWSSLVAQRFFSLLRESPPEFDVRILLDTSNREARAACRQDLGELQYLQHVHEFSADELVGRLGYAFFKRDRLLPGSVHYPVIDFGLRGEYDNFWVIEYDVVAKNGWAPFFSLFSAVKADLLCAHLVRRRDSRSWVWWSKCEFPVGVWLRVFWRMGVLPKAFLPVYRISRNGLEKVHEMHTAGVKAHQEFVLPLAVWLGRLDVLDMNAVAPVYKPGALADGEAGGRLSSYRWRPVIVEEEIQDSPYILHHPAK